MWRDVLVSVLNDPVRLYLLAGDVLATVAVGVGIISEHGPEIVRKGADRLVIGGVIVETLCSVLLFVYDGVNSFSQQKIIESQQVVIASQNAKIIELQTKLAPRVLTDEQFELLITVAKRVAPQQYTLSIAVGSEPAALICRIDDALNKAGWKRQPPTDFLHTKPCNNADWEVGVNLLSAIHIRVKPDASAYVRGAALSLANVLGNANIEAYAENDPINIKDAANIAVMIGAKL